MALALLGFVVIELLAVEVFAPCWDTVDGFSSTLSIFSSDKLLICALTGLSSPGLPASCKKTPHKGLAGYILPFLIPAYIQSPSTKTKVLKTIMEVIFQFTNTFSATAALCPTIFCLKSKAVVKSMYIYHKKKNKQEESISEQPAGEIFCDASSSSLPSWSSSSVPLPE